MDSINYCIEKKGIIVYARVLLSNLVHLIIESTNEPLQDIMLDLKRLTSKKIIKLGNTKRINKTYGTYQGKLNPG